jgi:hypothetical protein
MGLSAEKRAKKPVNRWGCKPNLGKCLEHNETLGCKHGCGYAKEHACREKADKAGTPQVPEAAQ